MHQWKLLSSQWKKSKKGRVLNVNRRERQKGVSKRDKKQNYVQNIVQHNWFFIKAPQVNWDFTSFDARAHTKFFLYRTFFSRALSLSLSRINVNLLNNKIIAFAILNIRLINKMAYNFPVTILFTLLTLSQNSQLVKWRENRENRVCVSDREKQQNLNHKMMHN